MSDAAIITTSFVPALYFGGYQDNVRYFMKMKGCVPDMLNKSRFCKRLYRLSAFLLLLFSAVGRQLKDMAGAADYSLDSFPVAVCDNIRISRSKVLKGEMFRANHAFVHQTPIA